MPAPLRVEGHTDDVPIHTVRFRSNWNLSTARATRVVEFLSTRAGIAPARLSAAGYGEFHPRGPNDSPAGRARNRRVDIVVLNDSTRAAEEPDAHHDRSSEGPQLGLREETVRNP
jgi:chemotaxis protein MotB